MKSKHKAGLWKLWKGWIRPLVVILIVTGAFRSAVADWNDVPTGSMRPGIVEGDRIFVNKLAYDLKVPFTTWRIAEWSAPARGDIVVLYSPADGKRLVKRVVALGGDRVEMRDNRLSINGRPAEYASQENPDAAAGQSDAFPAARLRRETVAGHSRRIQTLPGLRARRSFGPITVPPGHYFVMGDNRDRSLDSRFFGCTDGRMILGKATGVAFSLDRENFYRPRWRRFFHRLR